MNIRFPSITEMADKGLATLNRFPMALMMALIAAVAGIWLAEIDGNQTPDYYEYLANICWLAALGISVFISGVTYAESNNWKSQKIWLVRGAVFILLVLYFLLLPMGFNPDETEPFFRYVLFFFAAHLLVSFAPFLQGQNIADFWAYNKTLFLHILTAVLYSGVLFAGLSIAMLSLDNLLGFDISDKRYLQLWILLASIFNTLFFLSGVPKPHQISAKERAYPGGLKVFVQYVLIPLITIYISILYLYMGKILMEWEWPNGWVANLVLSFSIAGILALLLLHPIRDKAKNRWIYFFSKGYYLALIPLIILLMLSIWVRISEYGVTVNRYFVAALAVWLAGIVAFFIFGKVKNIKVIPISLCAITLLISFGPQGAFETAKRSQLHRLETQLQSHNLLNENGKVIKTDKELPFDVRKQISSSVNYLLDLKGASVLQPYFQQNLDTVLEVKNRSYAYPAKASKITDLIGIEYVNEWQKNPEQEEDRGMFIFTISPDAGISISGFDFYLGRFEIYDESISKEVEVAGNHFMIDYEAESQSIQIKKTKADQKLTVLLDEWMHKLVEEKGKWNHNWTPVEMMTLEQKSDRMNVKVVVRKLRGRVDEGEETIQDMTVDVYVSLIP